MNRWRLQNQSVNCIKRSRCDVRKCMQTSVTSLSSVISSSMFPSMSLPEALCLSVSVYLSPSLCLYLCISRALSLSAKVCVVNNSFTQRTQRVSSIGYRWCLTDISYLNSYPLSAMLFPLFLFVCFFFLFRLLLLFHLVVLQRCIVSEGM